MPEAEEIEFEWGGATKPRMFDSSRWCCAPETNQVKINFTMNNIEKDLICTLNSKYFYPRPIDLSFIQWASRRFFLHVFHTNFSTLFHGPWWHNFVRVLFCVMSCKSIPCLEDSLTDNTDVGHVQVNLCMSLSCLLSQKVFVAAEAEEPSIMSSWYHLIHKRVQVGCEESIRFLIRLKWAINKNKFVYFFI